MSETEPILSPPRSRARSLGLATATALVIGNMVGSGIFLLPASLAPYGVYSLWGWGFSTLGALLLGWVFCRLARRLPRAGGPYVYARAGFGDFIGFLTAWGYWISMLAGNAAIAVAFASYLSVFFPVLATTPLFGALAALAAVWVLTAVNIRGVGVAGVVQLATVILKLAPLLALAVFGIWYFDPGNVSGEVTAAQTGFGAVTAAAALTLWAFLGLESATVPAGHVRDARRTIPRATLIGIAIAAAFYIACTTVVMGIVPGNVLAHSPAPFAEAAERIWGGAGGYVIAATAVIACFGTLNGWILLSGQLPQAVAKDGLFPRFFGRETKHATPAVGLAVAGIVVSLIIMMNYTRGLVGLFTFVIRLATLSALIPYLFSAMADLVLGRGDSIRPIARIRDIAVAMLAFVFALWAVAGTGKAAVYWGLLLLLVGLPVYVWLTRRRAPD